MAILFKHYGVYSDVKDLKNILMWMVVLELKGSFVKVQKNLSQGLKYGTAWKVNC